MFLIAIPVDDLIEGKVLPEAGFSEFKLIEQLTKYYAYGPYVPKVHIEDGMALIEVDDELIIRDETAFRKAVSLCEQGRFKEAAPKMKALVDKSPTVSEYNRLYGQILSELGDQKGATAYLSEAIKWDYNNKWAFIMLGNIHAKYNDDLDKALRFYERALKIEPDNNILINNIGANLASRGDFGKAMEYFKKAMALDAGYPNTHYGIALAHSIQNDHRAAFEYSVASMKLGKRKDALYGQALQLALTSAVKIAEQSDMMPIVREVIDRIEQDTGKTTRIEVDEQLTTAAKVQIAEHYDRDYHFVTYNPRHPAYQHLLLHELMHVLFVNRARAIGRNKLFVSTGEMRERFIRDNEQTVTRLVKKGYPAEKVSEYISEFYTGLNMQLFNASIDMMLEDEIHASYPDMRPLQMLSLLSIVKSGIDACSGKAAKELSPRKHLSNSRILNALTARHYAGLYGVKMEDELDCDYDERKKIDTLYRDYLETKKTFVPGDEFDLVDKNALVLKLEKYYSLVLEQDYKAAKENPKPERQESGTKGAGLNMAVVMYLVSAINTMLDLDREKVREIAYEIAQKGRGGIDTTSTELDQTLETVPGKKFTGLQLTAWMYAAWTIVEPSLDSGLDYEAEYEAAMKLVEIENRGKDQE